MSQPQKLERRTVTEPVKIFSRKRHPKPASSPSKVVSPPPNAGTSITPLPAPDDHRIAALEKELDRTRRRAHARGKEAEALRKRVQDLEPEVRRLEKELDRRRARQTSCSPTRPAAISSNTEENDVALRGRLAAAENRSKALQLRCEQLERERRSGPRAREVVGGDAAVDGVLHPATSTEERCTPNKEIDAERIKQQLEVAERRVKNSLYINEAHESLAAKAAAREQEANARAAELDRRLRRALEKLESIERKDTIVGLAASCARDQEGIHFAERELRAHQMDPELYLPVNTAKRRQLARSEQGLRRLRQRYESQSAALSNARAIERLHVDLRGAAGRGDIAETKRLLEAGISVNLPDQAGLTAFLYACGQSNVDLVRILIDAGGDVLDGDGSITGLIIAARKGNVDVLQTLIQQGSSVHARDCAGGTALHAAARRGHVDASRLLLEAGSDSNAVDQGTNTPLHVVAASAGNRGTTCARAGEKLVSLLLDWGASVEVKNSNGLTPMSAALDARNRSLVLAYREYFGQDMDPEIVEGGGSGSTVASEHAAGISRQDIEGAKQPAEMAVSKCYVTKARG